MQFDVAVEKLLLQSRPPRSCSQRYLHVDFKQAYCTSFIATGQKSRRVVTARCMPDIAADAAG